MLRHEALYIYDSARDIANKNSLTVYLNHRRIIINNAVTESVCEIYDGNTLDTLMEIHYGSPNKIIIYDDWLYGECEKDYIVKEAQDVL